MEQLRNRDEYMLKNVTGKIMDITVIETWINQTLQEAEHLQDYGTHGSQLFKRKKGKLLAL